ncbi:unnamed protein product [Rangifer tarandus platyrhynchus]|uniref:Uncharacterized protein n=1 Tax=Rangifer tarandus platyrhynchus TaxID=3082113 RepID=A0AC60A3P0_RANTA
MAPGACPCHAWSMRLVSSVPSLLLPRPQAPCHDERTRLGITQQPAHLAPVTPRGLATLSSCWLLARQVLPAPQLLPASAAGMASPGLGPFPTLSPALHPCDAQSQNHWMTHGGSHNHLAGCYLSGRGG